MKLVLTTVTIVLAFLNINAQTTNPGTWIKTKDGDCKYYYTGTISNISVDWDGGCLNNLLSGRGALNIYESNVLTLTFIGEMLNGVEHGNGLYKFTDGTVISGLFNNGQIVQTATIVYKNGDVFEGKIKNLKKEGEGIYKTAKGETYAGTFMNDEISGRVKITYSDGTIYDGEFKNGKYNGKGTILYKNGTRIEGQFVNSEPSGDFKIYFENGARYFGKVNNAYSPHGKGTLTRRNRSEYVGDFFEGKMHGNGTMTFEDRTSTYTGEWFENEMQGQGVLTATNPETKFTGEFKNNLRYNGYSVEKNALGEITYQGPYENFMPFPGNLETMQVKFLNYDATYEGGTYFDRGTGTKAMMGKGKLTFTSGDYTGIVFEGFFYNNRFKEGPFTLTTEDGIKFISEMSNKGNRSSDFYFLTTRAKGKIVMPNGHFFSGTIENLQPQEGVLKFSNGWQFSGTFSEGLPKEGTLTISNNRQYKGNIVNFQDCIFVGELYQDRDRFIKPTNIPYNGVVVFWDNTVRTMVNGKIN